MAGQSASAVVFVVFTVPVLFLLLFHIVRSLRRGEIGLDMSFATGRASY